MVTRETSIAPWLSVADAAGALDFYRKAFGAVETNRLDGEDGRPVVAQLAIDGAAFWVQEDAETDSAAVAAPPVRMTVTVNDPDAAYERAVASGATSIAAVHEDYGLEDWPHPRSLRARLGVQPPNRRQVAPASRSPDPARAAPTGRTSLASGPRRP